MRAVGVAYGRALAAQLHPRMLFLSVVPFVLSVVLWGVVLWFGLQPAIDALHAAFTEYNLFRTAGDTLAGIGMGTLKAVVVPLLAMLLLLPLMILTALVFMGVAAMPAIVRHVSTRHYPQLERKRGGSWLGGVLIALATFVVFVLLFIATLPLYAVPPLAVAVHVVLWGWLTYRVVTYDALADHASDEERKAIMTLHKRPLLAIGMISGAAGAIPGLVWVGGAVMSFVLFPFLAAASIWLYVVVFIFTGLWFEYYCLQALSELRAQESRQATIIPT